MQRRTKEDIEAEAQQILGVLSSGSKRAEEIAEVMGVSARRLEKPLKVLRRDRRIRVSGAKRWTYYRLF